MKKIDELKIKIEKHIQHFGGPGSGRRPGDGSGGGNAGGSKGPSMEKQAIITDKEEIEKIMAQPRPKAPKVDNTPNGKTSDGEPLRAYSEKEMKEQIEHHMNTPVEIYGPRNKGGAKDTPDELEYIGRERATQVAVSTMTGSWMSPADAKDFLDGNLSITKGGTTYAMKGSKVI